MDSVTITALLCIAGFLIFFIWSQQTYLDLEERHIKLEKKNEKYKPTFEDYYFADWKLNKMLFVTKFPNDKRYVSLIRQFRFQMILLLSFFILLIIHFGP